VTDDELVTGRFLGLQIKGGDSYFVEARGNEGWVFRSDSNHLAYWLSYSVPVLVVIVDSDDRAFWQVVTPFAVRETPKGFAMMIPRSQPFDVSAREKLLEMAGRSTGLLESVRPSMQSCRRMLSPATARTDNDRPGATRLAELSSFRHHHYFIISLRNIEIMK
jgi:hypothetical protein